MHHKNRQGGTVAWITKRNAAFSMVYQDDGACADLLVRVLGYY